jgi:hypothetical protein
VTRACPRNLTKCFNDENEVEECEERTFEFFETGEILRKRLSRRTRRSISLRFL